MENTIRILLCESFEYQKKYGVSNACIAVSIIADKVLKMLDIPSKIVYGHIPGKYPVNHVWVQSNDLVIDFAYFEDLSIQITKPTTPDTFYTELISREEGILTDNYFQGDEETQSLGIPMGHHQEFVNAKNHPDITLRKCLKFDHLKNYYHDMLKLGLYILKDPNSIATLSLKWE